MSQWLRRHATLMLRRACCGAGSGKALRIRSKPFRGTARSSREQQELTQLRREVAKLKAERDILKKAAAYFAKELT